MSQLKRIEQSALDIAITALSDIAAGAVTDVTALARSSLGKIQALQPTGHSASSVSAEQVPSGRYLVYSDGGCKGNPGPAGWGAVVLDEASGLVIEEAAGFIGVATNQVAELMAAIEGLSRVPVGATVVLISDSQYTLKGLTEWRANWLKRGWRNSTGQPVANKEYWERLYAVADQRKVTTRWVKGHSGIFYNERADALAANVIASTHDI